MGGNAVVINRETHETFFAEKIPLQAIGRSTFVQTIENFLVNFNNLFYESSGEKLWSDEELNSGNLFNGSTSYIMNPMFSDEDIESVKPYAGDIDVIVNRKLKKKLYDFLFSLEGKDICDDVKYLGTNKKEFRPYMSQMNCIFSIIFRIPNTGELRIHSQVDFEFAEFINGEPSEFAKFGHSSSIKDAKEGIKAFHHKYLLRSLVGCLYTDKNGIVVLNGQELNKPARTKIFDVDLGVCDQLKKISDGEKTVYEQLPRFRFKSITDVPEIFKICFNREPDQDDFDMFWSFTGLCELIKKYTSKDMIPEIHQRYVNLLWSATPERTQELERGNPQTDLDVKLSGYEYFIAKFNLNDLHEPMISDYYTGFGMSGRCNLAESFSSFVSLKKYVHEDF